MRVCMDKNEENEKLQLRNHPQNTTTLSKFLGTKTKGNIDHRDTKVIQG